MSDMKHALEKAGIKGGGEMSAPKKCKCGNTIKDPKFDTCYNCSQKSREVSGYSGTSKSNSKIPDNYLKNGYFDNKEHLREGIFKEEAKEVANVIAAEGMTPTALRVFYNKLKAIESRYKSSKNDFDLIKPNIYAFERDVAYQASRGVVKEEFRKFITINAAIAAKGPKEFKGFIEHFLSVLAYFKDISR